MNIFAIKIKDRFFYEYKNKRINTAWSLAGAKLFTPFTEEVEKLEKLFFDKKVKFEKVFIQVAEEVKKQVDEDEFEFKKIETPNDGKKREKLILRFKLPQITSKSLIEILCVHGYRETGNKFSISFNGSKGYLSNFEISCEGYQKANNRIFIENLYNKDRTLKSIGVNVFYSEENGIRLSTGNDEPQIIVKENEKVVRKTCAEVGDDLPF